MLEAYWGEDGLDSGLSTPILYPPAAAAALGQSPDLEQASHFIFIGWHNERCIVITGSGEENTNGEVGVKLSLMPVRN